MDEERLQRLERRLDELDQRSSAMERAMDRAMDRSRAAMNSVVPADARQHMRAAGRENLLAVRSLLDHWVERLAEDPASRPEPPNGSRENIRID